MLEDGILEMRITSPHSSANLTHVDLTSVRDSERQSLIPRDANVCLCIPASWIILPPEGEEVKIKNSNLATVFLLLNSMIGSGIVVQAYVFSQAGIVAAIFEYIIVALMLYQGVVLLIRSSERARIFHYSQLADKILGERGKIAIDGSIVITNAGALLSYVLIIGSLSSDVLQTFTGCAQGDWYCSPGFLTVPPIVCFTIPLCLVRNFGHLAIISYVSIAVIVSIIFLVLIGGPIIRTYYDNHDDDQLIRKGNFLGCIHTIGDIVFALGYITAIFHAYHGMDVKSIENFQVQARTTNTIGTMMCFVIGIVGYLCFLNNTETNILQNFHGYVGAVFQMGLILHLILYIPGDFVIFRSSLLKLFDQEVARQSDKSFVILTLSLILSITLIAIVLQVSLPSANALNAVINISGGLGGSVVFFIVPGLLARKLFEEEKDTVYWGHGLVIFGWVIIILVLLGIAI